MHPSLIHKDSLQLSIFCTMPKQASVSCSVPRAAFVQAGRAGRPYYSLPGRSVAVQVILPGAASSQMAQLTQPLDMMEHRALT